jgi:hypothetical protein
MEYLVLTRMLIAGPRHLHAVLDQSDMPYCGTVRAGSGLVPA